MKYGEQLVIFLEVALQKLIRQQRGRRSDRPLWNIDFHDGRNLLSSEEWVDIELVRTLAGVANALFQQICNTFSIRRLRPQELNPPTKALPLEEAPMCNPSPPSTRINLAGSVTVIISPSTAASALPLLPLPSLLKLSGVFLLLGIFPLAELAGGE